MVNVRYHFVVYTTNHIPVRVEYTTSTGVVCGESKCERGGFDGDGEVDGKSEYYAEYDSLGLFLYVNNKTNKIIKAETMVNDMIRIDKKEAHAYLTDYKPKSTIKYINQ